MNTDKSLQTLQDISFIPEEDMNFLKENKDVLYDMWKTVQRGRTETELRASVLNDENHPTADSKYWQMQREGNVQFEGVIGGAYDWEDGLEDLKIIEIEIEELEERKRKSENELEKRKVDCFIKKKQIEIQKRKMVMESSKESIVDRIRELKIINNIKNEVSPDMLYGKLSPDTHQSISLMLQMTERMMNMERALEMGGAVDINTYNNTKGIFTTFINMANKNENYKNALLERADERVKKFLSPRIKGSVNLLKNKKNIAFVDYGSCVYSGDILEEKGIGGSETAIIRMAEELVTLGYSVDVYSKKEGTHNGVSYFKEKQIKKYDIVIHSRGYSDEVTGSFNFMWVHDYLPEYVQESKVLLDAGKIDKYIVASQWQKKEMMQKLGMPEKIFFVCPHGVKKDYFVEQKRQKNKVVYSSTPYRGLEYLLEIWDDVKKEVPDAELHLYGGGDVYQSKLPKQELYEIAKEKGAIIHGNVSQKELAQEFCSADVLAYPSNFPEIFCITVAEAITAGLIIVSTNGTATEELEGGFYVSKDEYKETLIETLKNNELKEKIRTKNLKYNYDWKESAKYMAEFLACQDTQKTILFVQLNRKKQNGIALNAGGLIMPQGMRVDTISIWGLDVARGREKAIDLAMGENSRGTKYDYLFFLDDDVYLPKNALIQLLVDIHATDSSCVCGWYSKKYKPLEFAGMAKKDGVEVTLNNPESKIYEAGLCPMGATLIDVKKIESLGKPYFKLQTLDGGEDTFFTKKLLNSGHKCFIDAGIICMHKDLNTGEEFFYGEYNPENYTNEKYNTIV